MDAAFVWKLAKLGRVGSSHLRLDDDWADRLNYQITCFLHFLFIGVLGLRSYIGKPIQCWAPQEFNKAWEEYSENFCWVSNTFYAPINNNLPLRMDKSAKMIGYYQWTPIVLAVQALMFYIPCLVWRLFMTYSGFNVRRILQMAADTNTLIPDLNNKNIKFIARYMDTCINRNFRQCKRNQISVDNKQFNPRRRCKCFPRFNLQNSHGNFLFFLYGFIKVLYVINLMIQLYLMKRFLGTDSNFFGVKVLVDLIGGFEWNHSGNFPRVTFCEVQTKKLGENNIYNLQCVLPLNMFLEKIYIFLWFYYVVLGFLTVTSFTSWLLRMGPVKYRAKFIKKYLKILNAMRETDNVASLKFTENHLRPDGVFILYLVMINVGHIVAGDLTVELWNIYRHKSWQDNDNVKYFEVDCRHSLAPGVALHRYNQSRIDSDKSNNHDDIV